MKTENQMTRLALDILRDVIGVSVIMACIAMLCCAAHGQTVPVEVKTAAINAIKASDTDGMHEEGFIWGRDATGNVLIVVANSMPCGKTTCEEHYIATDPSILARLVSVEGFAHVHPRGDGIHKWVQPPSIEDMTFAADSPGALNLVFGSESKRVYFFNDKGMIKIIRLKEFLQ